MEGKGPICTAIWPAVHGHADKTAYAAGLPALCAAVTRALCTAVDHLAAPRHMRLFAHLSLIANYTWQGAQLHGMVYQPSTLTKSSLHDRAAVEPLL